MTTDEKNDEVKSSAGGDSKAASETLQVIKSAPQKKISNPFSTGSGGPNFENRVQAVFVIMMLAGAQVPCLPTWPIVRIKLQGRYAGYSTDDFIAFAKEKQGDRSAKLLGQIKHGVAITDNDPAFGDTIAGAWADYNDASLFDPLFDQLALISGPLSANDSENARTLLEWARSCETHEEFFTKVKLANFSSAEKRRKLEAFRSQLAKANGNVAVGDDETFQFLRRFHILGFDLDVESSTSLAIVYSLISIFRKEAIAEAFAVVAEKVSWYNENAGTITPENLPIEIKEIFVLPMTKTISPDLTNVSNPQNLKGEAADAVLYASLLGGWNENVPGDNEIVRELVEHD